MIAKGRICCFNCKFSSGKNCLIHEERIDWEDSCAKFERANTVCLNCVNYKSGFCHVQNDTVSPNEMCGYFKQIISNDLLKHKRR